MLAINVSILFLLVVARSRTRAVSTVTVRFRIVFTHNDLLDTYLYLMLMSSAAEAFICAHI